MQKGRKQSLGLDCGNYYRPSRHRVLCEHLICKSYSVHPSNQEVGICIHISQVREPRQRGKHQSQVESGTRTLC